MVIPQRNLAADLLRMMKFLFDGPSLARAGKGRRRYQERSVIKWICFI